MTLAQATERYLAAKPSNAHSVMIAGCSGPPLAEQHDPDLATLLPPPIIEAMAQAVAAPSDPAMLLDRENNSSGWRSIREAARSGSAFAVRVSADVLALDTDSLEQSTALERLGAELRRRGLHPVILASGQRDRRHLFCRISDGAMLDRTKDQARTARIDVRTGQYMRPPGAPHRLGLPVVFLDPSDPREALTLLQRTTQALARPLSPRMQAVLRDGDASRHGYPSRSHMIGALALAAVNANWTEEEFLTALLDSRHRAGDKIRPRRDRRNYVARCWLEASKKAAQSPRVTDPAAARATIADVRAAAAAHSWPGCSGNTDRVVLAAHIDLANRCGKLRYHASVRSLAAAAGTSPATASRANARLQAGGWLRLSERPRAGVALASVWTVSLPRQARRARNTQICEEGKSSPLVVRTPRNTQTSPRGGCLEECCAEYAADIWRHEGLGKAAERVWEALDEQRPQLARHVAEVVHRQRRTVERHLQRLEDCGLAVRDSAGWRRGASSLEDAALKLGVFGAGLRQRARHDEEREAYRRRLSEHSDVVAAACVRR